MVIEYRMRTNTQRREVSIDVVVAAEKRKKNCVRVPLLEDCAPSIIHVIRSRRVRVVPIGRTQNYYIQHDFFFFSAAHDSEK